MEVSDLLSSRIPEEEEGFVRNYLGEPVPEKKNEEGKTNLDLLKQEIVCGSGISWAICKYALRPR